MILMVKNKKLKSVDTRPGRARTSKEVEYYKKKHRENNKEKQKEYNKKHKLKKSFERVFAILPESEKSMCCCVLKVRGIDQPFSWNVVNLEVKQNTKLSKRLLLKLSGLEFI